MPDHLLMYHTMLKGSLCSCGLLGPLKPAAGRTTPELSEAFFGLCRAGVPWNPDQRAAGLYIYIRSFGHSSSEP